ncbi:hypothetical protein PIB30_001528 [Stylosanthes scabra]|uniref:Uncharacterized protein n=1 Tax=Stylosanthes scabra TaxID=79078 RepID=A0ABU6R3F6_9FABA|nr:hypothetical protein [Stylosanthes scabra]
MGYLFGQYRRLAGNFQGQGYFDLVSVFELKLLAMGWGILIKKPWKDCNAYFGDATCVLFPLQYQKNGEKAILKKRLGP